MTNIEAKEALLNQSPIIFSSPSYGEIEYRKISALIYRQFEGKIYITAELLDKNNNSVTISPLNCIKPKKS